MAVTDFFFALGVPVACELDRSQLDAHYRQRQAQWHPDRFVTASETEKLQALRHTSLLNDAYSTLKEPLRRAEHLLQLKDSDAATYPAPRLEPAFLLQQLELREELEQLGSRRDAVALAALEVMRQAVESQWTAHWHEFTAETARQDWCNARLSLQKLQFLHKLQEEIRHLEE
jgi:molecular chaperone HscB